MRDAFDHPADDCIVRPLGDAIHLAQSERLEGLAHFAGASDAAANLANLELLSIGFLRAHASPPSLSSPPVRPRRLRYSLSLCNCLSASNVALTTLCGFVVPSACVRMFRMP